MGDNGSRRRGLFSRCFFSCARHINHERHVWTPWRKPRGRRQLQAICLFENSMFFHTQSGGRAQ